MKRSHEGNSRLPTKAEQQRSNPSEMDGLIELGMKDEALRRARNALKHKPTPITAQTFHQALNAILTFADRAKSWTRLVESAYERLTGSRRREVAEIWTAKSAKVAENLSFT